MNAEVPTSLLLGVQAASGACFPSDDNNGVGNDLGKDLGRDLGKAARAAPVLLLGKGSRSQQIRGLALC